MFEVKQIERSEQLDLELLNQFWDDVDGVHAYDNEALERYLSNKQNVMLAAFMEEKVVGLLIATVVNKPYKDSDFMYVDEVDTHPRYRKQGIGKSLMNEILKVADDLDLDEVWLGTELENLAANALYTSYADIEKETFIGYTFALED